MDRNAERYIRDNLNQTLEDLRRLCRQPSVSARAEGIGQCALVVKEMLEEAGFSATIMPTADPRFPVVFGEIRGEGSKTLLLYNHYDVQPPEPLELWESPPFEPSVRGDKVFARGVSDDKGHIVARLAAIKALMKTRGKLPCSVKFCIEGAEEIGSPGFQEWVEAHRDLLRADACIWEGGGVDWEGNPSITLGLKGILYVELEARGASRDSHSSYATVVPNPAWRLTWALASLKDAHERVLIPGFYDSVRPATDHELAAIKAMPDEDEDLRKSLGLKGFIHGIKGFEFRRRHIMEPTCTICGMESGYTGEGAKTVLPSWARAKLDFRLVPDQRPEEILAKLEAHLKAKGFGDIVLSQVSGVNPARTPMSSPWVELVRRTAQEVYGKAPVMVPSMAGSGPMYSITDTLGLPVASSGIDYPDNRLHAPNENIRLDCFLLGILHASAIMEALEEGR